jgi:hypothetical protein
MLEPEKHHRYMLPFHQLSHETIETLDAERYATLCPFIASTKHKEIVAPT